MEYSSSFWNNKYRRKNTGWDIGYTSTPLKEYFNQLTNKDIKILVPGAGRGYEVEYLFRSGFKNVVYLDYSEEAAKEFQRMCPDFPGVNIVTSDFFKYSGKFDLIAEQTFFSSLHPNQRHDYIATVKNMLKKNGKLVGLYFNHQFNFEGPPFGGSDNEYKKLFEKDFKIKIMDTAYNSIKPRKNRELFILLQKKA